MVQRSYAVTPIHPRHLLTDVGLTALCGPALLVDQAAKLILRLDPAGRCDDYVHWLVGRALGEESAKLWGARG